MTSTDEEFSDFVAARADHLYRQAWLLTGSRPAAEDLVQTALTKAYAAWSRVRRADDPVAYVHGVLMKSFLSHRRRRASGEVPVAEPRTDDARGQVDPADAHVDRLALAGSLASLSRTDRAVVVLRYWDDRSVAETASALGLSEAAVKNRSLRALRRLGEKLSDLAGPSRSGLTPVPDDTRGGNS
jgi:RNA polymerase sigma-70 factor (sigma-E family)